MIYVPAWALLLLMAFAAGSVIVMMRMIQNNPGAAPWSDEEPPTALLAGDIENWPSKDELAAMLAAGGLKATAGAHAIRLDACPSFAFRDFGGPAKPSVSGDDDSVDNLQAITAKVSAILALNDIRHRFEVYDGDGSLVAEFRHE